MFVSKNNVKILNLHVLEERIRFVITKRAVSRVGYSGIYSHQTNMISGKIFTSSSIQVQTSEGRLCIVFLSNLQHHSGFPQRKVQHHCSPVMNLFHHQL
jgi:hypothetical protein